MLMAAMICISVLISLAAYRASSTGNIHSRLLLMGRTAGQLCCAQALMQNGREIAMHLSYGS